MQGDKRWGLVGWILYLFPFFSFVFFLQSHREETDSQIQRKTTNKSARQVFVPCRCLSGWFLCSRRLLLQSLHSQKESGCLVPASKKTENKNGGMTNGQKFHICFDLFWAQPFHRDHRQT
jgi:hypothetical protein